MQLPASAVATKFNERKKREGSLWEHPYHCTIIQDGQHLLNCLRYVSMNMVRAGAVKHPSEWRWSAHNELTGTRSRYRILDIERLLERLDISRLEDFRAVYADGIENLLQRDELVREPEWSEALAVGDRLFVEEIAKNYSARSKFQYSEVPQESNPDVWAVKELRDPYSSVLTPKRASKHMWNG